ncbi:MAG TPA: bifunctional metallophosphatase/5'-nucleotidase [Candidatus Limnocylindria bacterium]|nr:bifunctional metallophosphatase/5'-nucleotidase [Candidatus Limnocylindria bacterium]
MIRRWLVASSLASAVAILIVLGATAVTGRDKPPVIRDGSTIEVQILALNDFHGNVLPPSGSSGRVGTTNAGGAEYLSTHIQNLKATNANSIVVSAGDLIGASPLLSALFHDEPTIEAMNLIGLDLNAVGNHEFDEGTTELLRMQNGGCHPVDGCQDETGFAGADFQFLAANVVNHNSGQTLFAPYTIRNFNGAKVAFIGMTLEGTPNIVSPSGVAGFDFLDEADTVNALIPEIQEQDVEAIVVLLHEGGSPTSLSINGCAGVTGAVIDIAERMDDAVDLIVSGHTHQPYSCVFGGIPVTSAFSFGRLVTDIDMKVDRKTKDVTSLAINNRIVTRDVPLDQRITDLIAHYQVFAAPIANRVIGHITADITRTNDASLEQSMGNVIADAQLDATDDVGFGEAVLSFMNPGGVRADLIYASSPAGEGDGVVTYGELFTVQPFGNSLVTMTLTGAQIEQALEHQFCGLNSPLNNFFFKVLLPSDGFHYTWDSAAANSADGMSCATADAVDPASITLNGVPLDMAASYRVTVNIFLADGGDGFPVFAQGTNRLGGAVDTDAFEAYLAANEPGGISPAPLDRIDVILP